MQLIILSPNLHLIFSSEQREKLENEFEVLYFTEPRNIDSIEELQTDKEKIIAIDPDFCNWKVISNDLEKIKNMRAICLQTTAFHYIDTNYLIERGIPVMNLRGFSTNAVAEQALMMIFALARKLPMVLREGCMVNFEKYRGIELFGKNLGIIGLGRIGSRIAELGKGIGMNVSYWSQKSKNKNYQYKDLDNLLKSSDIIVYALAKNDETLKILGEDTLQLIQSHALLVTITHLRHELFISMVETGKLGGYACDENIGRPDDFTSNILPGAELGWCTDECFKRNGEQWIETILDAKKGHYPNRIN